MSKKTSAIYKCLDNLEELRKCLISYCKNGEVVIDDSGSNSDAVCNINDSNYINYIDNIDFQFQQELRTLRFWFDSLYKYNGKSTSVSKKNASAKNGLKGGRPPKEISLTKKRISVLEDEVIPELEHKIVMADSNDEVSELENQKTNAEKELLECKNRIDVWLHNRNA